MTWEPYWLVDFNGPGSNWLLARFIRRAWILLVSENTSGWLTCVTRREVSPISFGAMSCESFDNRYDRTRRPVLVQIRLLSSLWRKWRHLIVNLRKLDFSPPYVASDECCWRADWWEWWIPLCVIARLKGNQDMVYANITSNIVPMFFLTVEQCENSYSSVLSVQKGASFWSNSWMFEWRHCHLAYCGYNHTSRLSPEIVTA